MTKQEFAQTVKTKYPEYKNVDDNTLADKVLAKYPEYQSRITEEKSGGFVGAVKAVGNFLTNSEQAFGKTLGTAMSVIDPETKRLRNSVLSSSQIQFDTYMKLARETSDKTKKASYLKAAKQSADLEGVDVFNSPEYQKTAKQIIGEGLGVGLDILAFGTYGKATQGAKSFVPLVKEGGLGAKVLTKLGVPFVKKTVAEKVATEAVKKPLMSGFANAAKNIGKSSAYGGAYGATEAMKENKNTADIIKQTATGAVIGAGIGAVPEIGKLAFNALATGANKAANLANKSLYSFNKKSFINLIDKTEKELTDNFNKKLVDENFYNSSKTLMGTVREFVEVQEKLAPAEYKKFNEYLNKTSSLITSVTGAKPEALLGKSLVNLFSKHIIKLGLGAIGIATGGLSNMIIFGYVGNLIEKGLLKKFGSVEGTALVDKYLGKSLNKIGNVDVKLLTNGNFGLEFDRIANFIADKVVEDTKNE